MKFVIYAVGSNDILSNEIRMALEQIFDGSLEIVSCNIAQLPEHLDGTLYICNESLKKNVQRLVDSSQICVLDLQPRSSFFMAISSIPQGSDIYIFNNKQGYCNTLEALCRAFGLVNYQFIPIAYEEMDRVEIEKRLSKACYIIGVAEILDKLRFEPFEKHLKPQAQLIGAKRVVSVGTTNEIIRRLNQLIYHIISNQLHNLGDTVQLLRQQSQLYMYCEAISRAIDNIQITMQEAISQRPADEKANLVTRAAINQLH